MLNVVAVMGRLGADPELRTTPQGTSVATFNIACDRNFARQGEQRQTDWFTVVAWRQQAEFVCKYFQKGSLIVVNGSLQSRSYQAKDGSTRSVVEIVADQINFAGPRNGNSNAQTQTSREYVHPGMASQEQNVGFSAGIPEDFSVIADGEDLPF